MIPTPGMKNEVTEPLQDQNLSADLHQRSPCEVPAMHDRNTK